MDYISGKDFLKTLNCLEIETGSITGESLDWLFDKRDTSDIVNWLCSYVNENNIETCNEIKEYTAMINGTHQSQKYTKEVGKNSIVLLDVCNVNKFEINSLKRDIEHASRKSDYLRKLTNKYLVLDGKFNRNIEDDEMKLRIKRKSYLSACTEAGKRVDELRSGLYKKEEQFSNILSNYNMMQEKYFIFQMPLHLYEQQCEIFQTNLHLWMRKNFEISKFNYSEEDINHIDQEFNRLYFIVKKSVIQQIYSECHREEVKAKLNYLQNSTYTEISFERSRAQEIQYTSQINILLEDLQTLHTDDLQEAAENFSENLVNTVLIKNAEIKLNHCTDRLNSLKNLSNEIIKALAQYYLLFLLLKTDKMKLRNIDKFLDDLYFYSSNYLTKYSIRSQLITEIENNVAKQDFSFPEIISMLTEKYNNEPINIRSVILEAEKQKVTMENLENDLFITKNLKYLQDLKEIEQNVTKVKKWIWCGPTLQPVIIPFDFLDNLNVCNDHIEKVTKMIKTSVENFNNTRGLIKNNTWLTHRRLLWVWFLTKPEKISFIIEQLKNCITEKARTST